VSTTYPSISAIRRKVETRERISTADALLLSREATDEEMRSLASLVRARFHAPDACTYLLMRIINTTNVCVAQCDYCAFYALPGQQGGYVLTEAQIFAKIDELLALGGELAGFNGGFNPQLSLEFYCDLVRAIRARYGDRIELYAFTIAEFMYLADHASLSYAATAQRLKQAGVRWITGGGSEILT
jgi:cyclic dehypoxanthinyl futalosine synthase